MESPSSTSNPWGSRRDTLNIRLNLGKNNSVLDQSNCQSRLKSRSLTNRRYRSASMKSHALYRLNAADSSSERLLPPPLARYRDEESSPLQFPDSDVESKRSTWSSDPPDWASSSPTAVMLRSPFGGSMDEFNTQTVAEKYSISPSQGLLIYPEDIEKDDWLHNPDLSEEDPDTCFIWNRRGIVNCLGLILIVLGILTLFIGYPILFVFSCSFTHSSIY